MRTGTKRRRSDRALELRQLNALKLESLRLRQIIETKEAQVTSLRAIIQNLQTEVDDLRSSR